MEIKRKKISGSFEYFKFQQTFLHLRNCCFSYNIISHQIFRWSDIVFWIIIISFLYGLIMPLLVSAYVYDFSGYYNFKWL